MSTKYRPNVAVIVTDGQGRVLLCYRLEKDLKYRVQTVQGGIDPGETPEQAAEKELSEEIGLEPGQYRLLKSSETKYRYDWSEEIKAKVPDSEFIGQEQQYFLVQVDPNVEFKLDTHHQEFEKVIWGTPEELVRLAWNKKRPGLAGALIEFGLLPVDFDYTRL